MKNAVHLPLLSLALTLALNACAEPPVMKVTMKDNNAAAEGKDADAKGEAGVAVPSIPSIGSNSGPAPGGSSTTQNGSLPGPVAPKPTATPAPNPSPSPIPMPSPPLSTPSNGSKPLAGDVIVQLFNWPFKQITDEMDTLASSGYAQIHVSPPNLSIATNQWWGRYQPVDYRLIAGPLGNEAEFKQMIAKAHEKGVKIIVDLVLNHTYNPTSPLPPEAGQLNASMGKLFNDSTDFHTAFCITDYNNPTMVRDGRMCGGGSDPGMPDLNQGSANVLKVQRHYISRLNGMGVDGYRFDAVKHMEVDYFSKLLAGDLVKDKFVFGEIIADSSAYERDMAPYIKGTSMKYYDFPLRKTLQDAFQNNGSLATLADPNLVSSKRALPANRGVVFIMNHDIPNNSGFRGMISEIKAEELTYAYILGAGHVGVPYVYSDLGIASNAGLVDDRWKNAHRNAKLVNMVKFHNQMMGEGTTILSSNSCALAIQRGTKGILFINKCNTPQSISVASSGTNAAKSLKNFETGESIRLSGETSFSIPAQSSLFFLTVL